MSYLFANSYCSYGSHCKNLKWFAIPFTSGPRFMRTLHHDPSILGGPTQHGQVGTFNFAPFSTLKILFYYRNILLLIFPMPQMVKGSACKAGYPGSIPESRRSPGEGNGYPPQYSCLENPMDRGSWRAIVHEVTKSWRWLTFSYYFFFFCLIYFT